MSRLVVGLALLVGCGNDSLSVSLDAYTGAYHTTSHTYAAGQGASIACTTTGAAVSPATPSFTLSPDTFFMDASLLVLSECTDAAGASCMETLVELRGGSLGLESESANSQTGGGTTCSLHYAAAKASIDDDTNTITIESIEKYEDPGGPEADCTYERALALRTSTQCRSVERWVGTKL